MSWDEKDWYFLTFYEGDEDVLRLAAGEFGYRREYKYEKNRLTFYECSKFLTVFNNDEIEKLQDIANKYKIKISYWYSGQGTIILKPIQ